MPNNSLFLFYQLSVETIDISECQSLLVPISESIISLLLKLHSQLSGKLDSYQPPTQPPQTTSSVTEGAIPFQCGDGAFYVGRLLDRLATGSSSCYECIVHNRLLLWPKAVVMQETATREDEEREQQERKRRARDRKQQMLKDIELEQTKFLKSLRVTEDVVSNDTDLDSTIMELDTPVNNDSSIATTSSVNTNTSSLSNAMIDIKETAKETGIEVHATNSQKSLLTVDCIICNQTVVVNAKQQREEPVGLVILVQVCLFY